MQVCTLRTLPFAPVTVLFLTLAGCGGGTARPPAVARVDSPAPAPTSVGPAASSGKVTKAEATLRATGGSSAAGTATFVQPADKVEYHIDVSGTSEGPHVLYLMQNPTCDTRGNRTGPLGPLDVSADGHGTIEGTMQIQLGTLVGRSLALYAGDKGDTEIVACGPLTAVQ
jgi:Cu/Zn superoxide dismutase